ncbi:adenosylcobinamide-phosphate synthase [Sphingomonas laterariae]|uniref:Cobalamin biosynthesis protein CobD n=1 Tax=Edaphosphingomonas laterariae TaxID=861865 RepID=A0A239JTM6_9SPHN|nr:adenosylcobinamide-phosphate synthase CbiB [Sphingomonas laterariae]SNT08912.1 adenosylcobinamide-phosphate synthase [Sphingomonas laterariae]
MVEPAGLVALFLDAAVGWPDRLYRVVGHPVGGFARLITAAERRWNRPQRSESARRLAGVALVLLLIVAVFTAALAVEQALWAGLGRWGWIGVGLCAFPGLAQRSLYDHVRPVARHLAAGDLPAARQAVGMIVGRDTAALDEAGVARAAIESLAESFCDGVAAPLFWLLLLGLPGLWVYKAINTADSLIGHKEARWRAFGWAAARTDDLLNWLPARLSGLLLCLAAPGGWGCLWRDHGKHASPNAGWPEAAMAGALGLRLAGPIAYDGVLSPKPWIGRGRADARAADIDRALALYVRACLLLWALAGGYAWAL